MAFLDALRQQQGISSVQPSTPGQFTPWTLDQFPQYQSTSTSPSWLNRVFENPANSPAARLAQQNEILSSMPGISGWTIDSPEFQKQVQDVSNNQESGGAASSLLQDMYGSASDTVQNTYDPNSRAGFAYGPGYKYSAKFDANGQPIPGTLTKTSLADPMFDAAVMGAIGVTGANILAAQSAMAGAGAAGSSAGGSTAGGAAGGAGGASGSGIGALSSADKAALFGNAGYGAGMTGAETAAFDAGLAGAGAGAGEVLPGAEYSHEGLHYGVGGLDPVTNAPVNVGAGAAGSVGSALSNLGGSFKDWALKNPMQAIQLAGALGGKLFGSGSSGGGGGIGSVDQSALTAAQPAAFQREYVAPPAGFKPGISGEHVYFKKKGG